MPSRRKDKDALWQSYMLEAALHYFNDRGLKPGLVIDNNIFRSDIFGGHSAIGESEYVLCMAPDFVTDLVFGGRSLDVTVKINNTESRLEIPYESMIALMGLSAEGTISLEGHFNVISIPQMPVWRREPEEEELHEFDENFEKELENQPTQREMLFGEENYPDHQSAPDNIRKIG